MTDIKKIAAAILDLAERDKGLTMMGLEELLADHLDLPPMMIIEADGSFHRVPEAPDVVFIDRGKRASIPSSNLDVNAILEARDKLNEAEVPDDGDPPHLQEDWGKPSSKRYRWNGATMHEGENFYRDRHGRPLFGDPK